MATKCKEVSQHYKTTLFRSFVAYVENNHPEVNIRKIIKDCGLDYNYIDSDYNWVSTKFERNFISKCIEATGDDDLSYKVGLTSLEIKGLGKSKYYLVKYILSLDKIFNTLPRLIMQLNRTLKIEVNQKESGIWIFSYKINSDKLSNNELKDVRESFPSVIRNIHGQLKALCLLKGYKNFNLVNLDGMNADSVDIQISVPELSSVTKKIKSIVYNLFFLVSSFIFLYLNKFSIISVYILTAVISSFFLIKLIFRYMTLKKISLEAQRSLELLDEKFEKELILSGELEANLKRQKLIADICQKLVKVESIDQMFDSIGKYFTDTIGFERVLFLKMNTKNNCLEYVYSKGVTDKQLLSNIKQFKLEMNKTDVSKQAISEVFRHKKTVVINDLDAFKSTLTEEDSIHLIDLSKTKKFVATPIFTDSRSYGVLLADFSDSSIKFTKDDQTLIETTCNILASYIEKEQTLIDKLNAMQLASSEREKILARTTHELKTPIHGIIGITQNILNKDSSLVETIEKDLNYILKSGRRLSKLIKSTLDEGSSIISSENAVENVDFNIKEEVDRILLGFSGHEKLDNVTIENNLIESCFIYADKDKFEQVIINVVGNSLKYTSDGFIKISGSKSGKMFKIIIEDSGKGINADEVQYVFKEFYQAKNSVGTVGHGIGLSLCKNLIEAMGGKISLRSILGKGTATEILLQNSAKMLNEKPDSNALVQVIQTKPDHSDHKKLIYIVDDDDINRHLLEGQLEILGYETKSFQSALLLLNDLETGILPVAILMDKMMPTIDGDTATRKIREKHSSFKLPIIMLTARQGIDSLVESFESGANDYIVKGDYRPVEMKARIDRATEITMLSNAYERLLPTPLLGALGYDSIVSLQPGDKRERDFTILFTDIRGFTSMSEGMSSSDISVFLTSYYSEILPIVYEHNGFVDKIVGDMVMALFESAADAVEVSRQIEKRMVQYNLKNREKMQNLIDVGVGMHSGPTTVAAIGNSQFLNLTVVGDTVNTADRFEKQCKNMGARIIVSEAVFESANLSSSDDVRKIGTVNFEGKSEAHNLFEIINTDSISEICTDKLVGSDKLYIENELKLKKNRMQNLNLINQAIDSISLKDYQAAIRYFKLIIENDSDDKVALYWLDSLSMYDKAAS